MSENIKKESDKDSKEIHIKPEYEIDRYGVVSIMKEKYFIKE